MMFFINYSRFVILFIFSLTPHNNHASVFELTFCGFEQTCSRNNTKQEQGIGADTCCRPCECEDICTEKETCCRDKRRDIDTRNDIKQECLKSAVVPKGHSLLFPISVMSFFNRASCPNDFNDIDIKRKCESDIPESITDIRPVSSRSGDVIYKNKYCSYCHGEKKAYGWQIIAHQASPSSCRNMFLQGSLNIDTITTELLKNCILVFVLPKYVDFWKVVCFDKASLVQNCNTTGHWSSYESGIKMDSNVCLNQSDGYYVFDNLFKGYSNANCFVCNGGTNGSCENSLGRFPGNTMFSLLNVNKLLDNAISEKQTIQCGNGEIMDTYFETCRMLHCFWKSIAIRGKCVHFVDHPIKTCYGLILKLIPNMYVLQTKFTGKDFVNMYVLIQEKLEFDNCDVCRITMFFEKRTPSNILHEMYVEFNFLPNKRCTIEQIWSKLMAAEIKLPIHVNSSVSGKWVYFKVYWSNGFRISTIQYKQVFDIGKTFNYNVFTPLRGEICPKVKLQEHEVQTTMKNHPNADQLIWIQNNEDINGSAFVCIEQYIISQLSLSPGRHLSCWMIAFTIIVSISDRSIIVYYG